MYLVSYILLFNSKNIYAVIFEVLYEGFVLQLISGILSFLNYKFLLHFTGVITFTESVSCSDMSNSLRPHGL